MDNNTAQDSNFNFDFKKEFFKYLYYWKTFLVFLICGLTFAFLYQRYSNKIYQTEAKVLIIDKNETALNLPSVEDLFSKSNINLENEIEIIKSTPILEKIIKKQKLNRIVYSRDKLGYMISESYPFKVTLNTSVDNLSKDEDFVYKIKTTPKGLLISSKKNKRKYLFEDFNTNSKKHDLPFEITNFQESKWNKKWYTVNLFTTYEMLRRLKNEIEVSQIGRDSEVLLLKHNSSNKIFSQKILNNLIYFFNEDGVQDRRLIHKRTIDFVNERYVYLISELDSIELNKQFYKLKNKIVDLSANSSLSLENSNKLTQETFNNNNQIYIVSELLKSIKKLDFQLLPTNVGIENLEINNLINNYNERILERKKIVLSAGENNPTLVQLNDIIFESQQNIVSSLSNYLIQLNDLKNKYSKEYNKFDSELSLLPEKEKNLRSIERTQQVTEALYLFLLQKREEAEVGYNVTEPSIKVVEYASSKRNHISPKVEIIYPFSIFLSFFIPFLILFIKFFFDTKVHSLDDLVESNYNGVVLGELPFIKDETLILKPSDRSLISESFRMLVTNLKYMFKVSKESKVILVGSSVKGEGKTYTAVNLSLSLASLNKKVLLIGFDLRNPQIHKYINEDKNQGGLINCLIDKNFDYKSILKDFSSEFENQKILLSGPVAPNPLSLINNGNFEILLKKLKKEFEYIVIDTAPTLLVADTNNLFSYADAIVYVVRSNYSEKNIVNHINKLSKNNPDKFSLVLNAVGQQNPYNYAYSYKYGYNYGYNYNYSYNYGYGYGYTEDKDE